MVLLKSRGHVFICILYIVCINICFSNAESVDKNDNEPLPKGTTLTFPSNVSDTYKGTWLAYNDTGVSALEFEKRGGAALFQILNRRSIVNGIDIVKGDLRIRDGVYSTDSTLAYYLQGIYLWQTGSLIMIANPMEEEPLIEDFVLELGRNSSIIDALQKANIDALSKIGNRTSHAKSKCYWSMNLHASPVSSDFNEKYASLYTNPIQESEEEFQRPTLEFSGIIFSPNCNVTIVIDASSLELDTYYSKATNYVVMVAIASFVQIILLIRQMDYTSTQTSASKVSLLMIGAQAMMDSYLCLLHLTGGIIVETVFNAFATAAFFQFIGFSVFEMRYLFTIWKARNPQSFTELRREFGMLYARFYGSLLLGFLFIYYIEGAMSLFIILMYSFLVPQIICNAQRGTNKALTKPYAIGSVVTRALIPMYFYGCPNNFVHAEPHYLFLFYLLAWLGLQLTVLFLQDYLGPRFFVPRQFLPAKYNYQRAYRGTEEPECVICMSTVDINGRDFMQTPCDHMFHEQCLLQWLDQKMECPTCRRPLPTV